MKSACLTPARLASQLLMLIFLASTLPAHAQTDPTTLVCRAESQVISNWKDDGTVMYSQSDKADDVYIFNISYAGYTYRSVSQRAEDRWSDVKGPVADQIRESLGKEKVCRCDSVRDRDCAWDLKNGRDSKYVGLTCNITQFAFDPLSLFFLATTHIPEGLPTTMTKAGSCSRL
jgi:hypothetical protein